MAHDLRMWRLVGVVLAMVLVWSSSGRVTAASSSEFARLQAVNDEAIVVRMHSQTGVVTSMRVPQTTIDVPQLRRLTGADVGVVAQTFVQEYGALFGLGQRDDSVREIRRDVDEAGTTHLRYQQYYREVPVLAGEMVLAVTAQRRIRSVHAEFLPMTTEPFDVLPRITAERAQTTARDIFRRIDADSSAQLQVSKPQLWVFNPQLVGGPLAPVTTLNWRMEVTGMTDDGPVREFVLVNAHTGVVTLHFSQIAHAMNQRICDNASKIDADWNPVNNCASDRQAARTNSAVDTGKADVDIAWEFTKATYDFYKEILNRDSIDNKGMQLISLVNYCGPGDCPFANAFWNGSMMTYGANFASADDVVAHELTHGVTEKTANLLYYYQSGAINEAFSDIMGEVVDRAHDGRSADAGDGAWLMGEDLPIGAIRSMQDPTLYDNPDKMTSTFFDSDPLLFDNGGVHTNSGVANKAAYLLAAGDTFNGQTVTGLGDTKVALLFYGTMTQYLTSGSDYADLADALVTVCDGYVQKGLYGFVGADCDQVDNAIAATEMTVTPTNAPATDATMCSGSNQPLVAWSESFENTKFPLWKTAPAKVWRSFGRYAPDGSKALYGLGLAKSGNATIQLKAPVLIPADAYLHFEHYYLFDYAAGYGYFDGGFVEYSSDGKTWTDAAALFEVNGYTQTLDDTSGNPSGGADAFAGPSNGYISSRLDLSSLADQRVYLRFRMAADYMSSSEWFIDNVQIYQCVSADTYVVQLTGMGDHTCATTLGDEVLCWGAGSAGQIGNGATADATKATFVVDSSDTRVSSERATAAGGEFACARQPGTRVACWGDNARGQLGNNTLVDSTKAVTVLLDATTPLTDVVRVATGAHHACALRADTSVYCWGAGSAGQLGNAAQVDQKVAVAVQKTGGVALTGVAQVVAGADHSCALLRDGSVWCWGDNATGELGVGATPLNSTVAVATMATTKKTLTGVRTLAAGADTTCAVTTKGAVLCWGRNTEGQIGNGTYTNALLPTAPKIGKKPLSGVTQIAMGLGSHVCVLDTSKNMYCWGSNANGQLGLMTTEAKTSPTLLHVTVKNALGAVVGLATGLTHTCAINTALAVYCWGDNTHGQLGDGGLVASSLVPVRVIDSNDVALGLP